MLRLLKAVKDNVLHLPSQCLMPVDTSSRFSGRMGLALPVFDIAYGKGWGALGMGFGSRELAERAERFPTFVAAISAATQGRMIPSPGGVLILDSTSNVLGAVGISGDVGDNDELCAIAGIKAAGLSTPGGP